MLCGDTASGGQRETAHGEGQSDTWHPRLARSKYPPPSPRVPGGRSGAGLRQGVGGPGDTLCVGDSGRLSLEDREWWRPEEKLRLVCRTDDCLEIFLKRVFLLLGGRTQRWWGKEEPRFLLKAGDLNLPRRTGPHQTPRYGEPEHPPRTNAILSHRVVPTCPGRPFSCSSYFSAPSASWSCSSARGRF